MGWQPDDHDEAIGKALIRREELANMATAFTLACIQRQVADPATTGFQLALEIKQNLDKETPFPE